MAPPELPETSNRHGRCGFREPMAAYCFYAPQPFRWEKPWFEPSCRCLARSLQCNRLVHRHLLTKRQQSGELVFTNNFQKANNIMNCNQTRNRFATPFGDLQVDVENLFEQVFGDRETKPQGSWTPRTNISESDTSYYVNVELAGVEPANVNVEMHDGVLEVSGQREKMELPEGVRALKVEQRTGEFRRKFEFSTLVDADRIEASYENGVLSIELPKSEKVLPRKINIKVAE